MLTFFDRLNARVSLVWSYLPKQMLICLRRLPHQALAGGLGSREADIQSQGLGLGSRWVVVITDLSGNTQSLL